MPPFAEPRKWTMARQQRMVARFPVLSTSDPDTVLGVDNLRASQGQEPSDFSMTAMRLGSFAAQSLRKD